MDKGRNITILGDSITGGIKRKEFNKHVKGNCYIKTFGGASSKCMISHVQPTIDRKDTDIAIIHAGTNSLTHKDFKNMSTQDIARSIINIGEKCRDGGINEVVFSNLVKRDNIKNPSRINEVNDHLKLMCNELSFGLIDNSNILDTDLSTDSLYLSFIGTCKLENNFINYINHSQNSSNN